MKAPHWICNEDDSRPVGPPGACTYCNVAIGQEHLPSCVVRSRTVVVEIKIRMVCAVPEHWTAEDIEFHMNDSSWCASNIIEELDDAYGREDGPCLCNNFEGRYIAEATEEDETSCGVSVSQEVAKHDKAREEKRMKRQAVPNEPQITVVEEIVPFSATDWQALQNTPRFQAVMKAMETPDARGYVDLTEANRLDDFGMDTQARCAECGGRLEIVRPGKYQCPTCEAKGDNPGTESKSNS